jgi:hypothetical protein
VAQALESLASLNPSVQTPVPPNNKNTAPDPVVSGTEELKQQQQTPQNTGSPSNSTYFNIPRKMEMLSFPLRLSLPLSHVRKTR